jgi:enoyl-CoA hydratase/carnithine racemase
MGDGDLVRFDTNGICAVITLKTPTNSNALRQSLYYRLPSLLLEAEEHPDVYFTVFISEGPFFLSKSSCL